MSGLKKYDAIIIGSGQAGTPLAFQFAKRKQSVAFIEKEHFGGTCLNVGCTPTKAYVASARRMWDYQQMEALGVDVKGSAQINLKKVKERKDNLVRSSVEGIAKGIEEDKNITVFKGKAEFTDLKTVTVNGQQLTAPQIFINVGGRPRIPEGFDSVPYLTNQSILELQEVPKHLIIIGGSYIGLEFGQMFRRFGSKVSIIEMNPHLIGREDEEISRTVEEILMNEGVHLRLKAKCISASLLDHERIRVDVDCEDGPPTLEGTHLLLATGRILNGDQLNLEATGLSLNDRGVIPVNDSLETKQKGIFALGDCNGKGAFTHTSYNDFEIISDHLWGKGKRKVSDRITTYSLFIDPPLGRAGMTRQQALDQGYEILEASYPMKKIARAREKGETQGLMNIIVDRQTNKILGAAVLGTGGDEIITSILQVMYADEPYTVIRDSVIPHPTISELIPTMLEELSAPENE